MTDSSEKEVIPSLDCTLTYFFPSGIMSSITEDEMDTIKERYELYDKKGDGKVDASQVIKVLQACGLNPLKSDVDKVK